MRMRGPRALLAELTGANLARQLATDYALDLPALVEEVAAVRTAAYVGRIREHLRALGIDDEDPAVDPDVLAGIAASARAEAEGIRDTYTADLSSEIAKQRDAGTLSRAAIVAWVVARAEWKADQVATVAVTGARPQADADIRAQNNFAQVWVRAVPQTSRHDACIALIGRGWIKAEDAPGLPLHPNCRHSWEQNKSLSDLARDRDRVWVGVWVDTERERQDRFDTRRTSGA